MTTATHSAVRDRIAQLQESGSPQAAICFRLRTDQAPEWALSAFGVLPPPRAPGTPPGFYAGFGAVNHTFHADPAPNVWAYAGPAGQAHVATTELDLRLRQSAEAVRQTKVQEILAFRGWRLLRRICERWVGVGMVQIPDAPRCARRMVQHFGILAEGLIDRRIGQFRPLLDSASNPQMIQALTKRLQLQADDPVPLAEADAYPEIPAELRPYIPDLARGFTGEAEQLGLYLRQSFGSRIIHDIGINLPDGPMPDGFSDFLWAHRQSSHWDDLVPLHLMWNEVPDRIKQLPIRELLRELHVIRARRFFRERVEAHPLHIARWKRSIWKPHLMPKGQAFSVSEPALDALHGSFLARTDPRGLVLGELTGCCQTAGQSADGCAWHGQEDPLGGFFVVEDFRNVVVAQSWIWRDDTGRALGFDSIECLANHAARKKCAEAIVLLYLRSALWCLGQTFGHGLPVGEIWLGPSSRLLAFTEIVSPVLVAQVGESPSPDLPPVLVPSVRGVEGHRDPRLLFPFRASWLLAADAVLTERDRLQALPDLELLAEFRERRAFRSPPLQEALLRAQQVQALQAAQAEPVPPHFPERWGLPQPPDATVPE